MRVISEGSGLTPMGRKIFIQALEVGQLSSGQRREDVLSRAINMCKVMEGTVKWRICGVLRRLDLLKQRYVHIITGK